MHSQTVHLESAVKQPNSATVRELSLTSDVMVNIRLAALRPGENPSGAGDDRVIYGGELKQPSVFFTRKESAISHTMEIFQGQKSLNDRAIYDATLKVVKPRRARNS